MKTVRVSSAPKREPVCKTTPIFVWGVERPKVRRSEHAQYTHHIHHIHPTDPYTHTSYRDTYVEHIHTHLHIHHSATHTQSHHTPHYIAGKVFTSETSSFRQRKPDTTPTQCDTQLIRLRTHKRTNEHTRTRTQTHKHTNTRTRWMCVCVFCAVGPFCDA